MTIITRMVRARADTNGSVCRVLTALFMFCQVKVEVSTKVMNDLVDL